MLSKDLKHSNFSKSHLKYYENRAPDFSGQFIRWFLEHMLRLDEFDADDAAVDAKHDKGVDAIFVDNTGETVYLVQAKTKTNDKAKLGDTDLKEFAGTLKQFSSKTSVDELAAETKNERLRQAIERTEVAEKIEVGYEVRGLFITNVSANDDALNYLKKVDGIDLYDAVRISEEYIDLEVDGGVDEKFFFDISDTDVIEYDAGGAAARIFLAPALNIVKMSGISDGRLFEQNVRLSLGNTKVNRSLRDSIKSKAEHANFPLYHNGINVLCSKITKTTDEKIHIKDYVVVNGAQSLTSLLAEKSKLSDDLKILVKLIEVKGDVALSQKITRNSNNQNSIKARDLKSNHAIQQRLKTEVEAVSKGATAYEIKQGETNAGKEVIPNENAGLVLLAIDLEMPWNCHQKYKVMDELHAQIFGRPQVTGSRVLALWKCFNAALPALDQIDDKQFAYYTLTRYYLVFLVANIIRSDPVGRKTMADLDKVVSNGKLKAFAREFADLAMSAANDLNAEIVAEKEADPDFDYKKLLKSPNWCRAMGAKVQAQYKKDVARKKAEPIAKSMSGMVKKA